MSPTNLAGATALITGATSGIGRAIAIDLAASGAHVLVGGRDEKRGAEVVATIRAAGGTAEFVGGELADPAAVRDLARRATELGGGHVDILVNNAAIYPPAGGTAGTAVEDIDAVYAINVRAPYLLVGELAPAMAARGHGAIVNVLSMVARFGMAGMGLYGSSKAALGLLTRAWAAEFGPAGVRVNAVSPGPTRTEGTARFGDFGDRLAAAAPAGRQADVAEIAAAVRFLVGGGASFVLGAVLDVDGGRAAV
jgi:NAD(P)-dependent dehydrogenase (short-subunit alcohol dehydrogenase family)